MNIKHSTFLLALLCLAFTCFADDLVIAEKGKTSNYQIVYPNSANVSSISMQNYVKLAGTYIQKAIYNATGVTLSMSVEAGMDKKKSHIFIGNTNALKNAELSTEDFAPWEHAIVVNGNDIFIYGTDLKNPTGSDGWFPYMTHGSMKAACVFAEKFVSTRVIGIDKSNTSLSQLTKGISTLPMEAVTIPSDYSYRFKPTILNSGVFDTYGHVYHVANGYYWSGSGVQFKVHWPTYAIPPETYNDKTKHPETYHPEYFALLNGIRPGQASEMQYCYSNPDVQELIYQEALARAKSGYSVVEFGQPDGFKGCECEACKKLYNTDDWGEKLWRFNSTLAARLKKECPNVKVAIASYGPTQQIPQSFDQFPVDMVLDIAPLSKQLAEAFQSFNVTDIACWAYMGGDFRPSGFSPGYSLNDLKKELDFYRSIHVAYIYDCGIDTAHWLSGPWIYAWGRWREVEDESPETLIHDYCLYAFGKDAAPYFEQFYTLMDSRLDLFPLDNNQDYNDVDVQSNGKAITLWQMRYPADVVTELTRLFNEGVSRCANDNYIIAPMTTEFEYLKLTANVCNLLKVWQADTNYDTGCALADALDARTALINALPTKEDGKTVAEKSGFEYISKEMLLAGGKMTAAFGSVFDMDSDSLRVRNAYVQAVPVADFNDPAWENAPVKTLMPLDENDTSNLNVTFQVGCTDDAFLFKITSPLVNSVTNSYAARTGDLWAYNDVKELFFSAGVGITQLAFSPVAKSEHVDDTSGGSWYIQSSNWSHTDTVKDGIWYSEVTVPYVFKKEISGQTSSYKLASFTYVPGKKLFLQVGFSTKNREKVYCWNVTDSSKDAYIACSTDLKNASGLNKKNFVADFGRLQAGTPEAESTVAQITAWDKGTVNKDGSLTYSVRSGTLTATTPVRFYLESTQIATVHVSCKNCTGDGIVKIYPQWYTSIGGWAANDQVSGYQGYIKDLPEDFTFSFNGVVGANKGGVYFKLLVELTSGGGSITINSIEVSTPNP